MRRWLASFVALCCLWVAAGTAVSGPQSHLLLFSPSGPAYNSQAKAFFSRLATQPNAARKARYNTFFASVSSAGITNCDAFYPYASRDSATALTNMLSSSYTATLTATAPVFSTDGGFVSLGTGSSIDSNINPATAVGLNYTQNSAALGAYTVTKNGIAGETAGYGTGGTGNSEIYPRYTTNQMFTALNAQVEGTVNSITDASGLRAVDRSSSANFVTYTNGVAGATTTSTSAALPSTDITFLTQGLHVYTFGSIQFGFVCGHLTAAQHLALYNAIVAYLTNLSSDYPTIQRLAGSRQDMPTINQTVAFATANTFNTRRMVYLNAPCKNPRVVYTGWGYSIGDANFANSYTVHTQIEYGGTPTFVNLTAGGSNTMTVNIGDVFDSTDSLPGTTIPAGQIWIRSFMTIGSGGLMYLTDYVPNSAVGDQAQQGTNLTDVSGGGTITTNMSFMVGGVLTCQVPNAQRAVVMITDSNGQGVGGYIQTVDGNGSGGGQGYLAGYLDTVMSSTAPAKSIGGYLHNGRTSYSASAFASSPGVNRLQFEALLNITDFWNQLGINDVNTGGSPTTAAANLAIVNNDYVNFSAGKITNVYQSTHVPQVSLSSTPPSDANQTDLSAGQVNALNVIIRAGTIGYQTAFVEVGTSMENTSVPNVNFWITTGAAAGTNGATHDGKHLYCVTTPCNTTNASGANVVVSTLQSANALNP